MGSNMTGIIEWTHDAQCATRSEELSLGEPRWADDYIHGILFHTDKEYDFFAAIAGVRNRFERPPLILPRGIPAQLSGPAQLHFQHFRPEVAGWLHLSEIDRSIEHLGAERDSFGFELAIALELMRTIVSKLSDPHVRLVFEIDSP